MKFSNQKIIDDLLIKKYYDEIKKEDDKFERLTIEIPNYEYYENKIKEEKKEPLRVIIIDI